MHHFMSLRNSSDFFASHPEINVLVFRLVPNNLKLVFIALQRFFSISFPPVEQSVVTPKQVLAFRCRGTEMFSVSGMFFCQDVKLYLNIKIKLPLICRCLMP